MGCRRYSAAKRLEVLLDEDDFRFSWRALERGSFLLHSQLQVNVYFLELSERLSTHGSLRSCLICVYVFVCVFVFCLQVQQTLARNSGWTFGPLTGLTVLVEFLVPSRPNKTSFSISWAVAHPRVSPFVIIGFSVLVGFVECLCCFPRLLNPILSYNYEGNRRRRPRCHIHVLGYNFSRLHHNNFRDPISWECVVKDDFVRSCLIELQSFPLSKLDIDPVHHVWGLFHVFCLYHARRGSVKSSLYGSLCSLSMGFTAVKNTVLSFPTWILSSRCQSWICDGV